jgi:CBS domain-containing protein
MKKPKTVKAHGRLVLWADTAADLMTPNPLSISQNATVKEAVAFLTDKGFSAAPVIDEAGRPVGVLSQADIVVYDREKVDYVPTRHEFDTGRTPAAPSGEPIPSGFHVENVDSTLARDVMTPVVFSVTPETAARKVIKEMLALRVHRLFVVGKDGVLVGVISTVDVLRHLAEEVMPSVRIPAVGASSLRSYGDV